MSEKNNYKYTGALHIHSLHSDGTGSIEEIAKAAKNAGLDWIIITDHNYFDDNEGIIEGVTVIKGEEISQESGNHYLAFGINKCIQPFDNVQDTINAVKKEGGFGFAAHPDESNSRKNVYVPIRWTDKNIIPDGIEIWNWFSLWADNYNGKNFFTKVYSYLFKNKITREPHKETIEWWDKLNSDTKKIIPAIGGVDAHAMKIKGYIIPVYVFPYKTMFKTVLNEIILNEPLNSDFHIRKNQILTALKNGKNIIFNKKILNNAPEFYIKNSNKTAFSTGAISLDLSTYLYFNCIKKADIKVFKDTKEIFKLNTDKLKIKISETGKYRVEATIKSYAAAYSNYIVVE